MKKNIFNLMKLFVYSTFLFFLSLAVFWAGPGWAETGGISGRVTDINGNGIANVWVSPLNTGTNSWGSGVNTDSNGYYTLSGLAEGNYKVQFGAWNIPGNYVSEYYSDKTWSTADLINVVAGQTTPNINAQLVQGGSISGRVTDISGNGIQNVSVNVYDLNNNNIGYGLTDSNGYYEAKGIPAGSCRVWFGKPSNSNYISEYYNDKVSFSTADLVNVVAGQTTPNINAQLVQGGSISGRVTDINGNGIQNVSVNVYDLNNNNLGYGPTDSNGYYEAKGIPAGSWKVWFGNPFNSNYISEYYNDKASSSTADLVNVVAGQTTPNINAQLIQGGTIAGRVTDSQGSAVPSLWVNACVPFESWYTCQNSGQTDTNGNYQIQGLLPGNYKITYSTWNTNYIRQWYNNKPDSNTADWVAAISGQTTANINAQLVLGGKISGQVTDPSGNALVSYPVRIYDPATGNQLYSAWTDSSGNYSLYNPIPPGNYQVFFSDYSSGYYSPSGLNVSPQWYNNKSGRTNADPVAVIGGQVTANINAQLGVGGQITGRATDASGNGIVNVEVRVVDPNNGQTIRTTRTDSSGNYTLSSLANGNYRVYIETSSAGYYVPEWYNDKGNNSNAANQVAVTAGQVTPNINTQLLVGGAIAGWVTDGSGNPLSGVSVNVVDLSGNNWLADGSTDFRGWYAIRLAPGQYRVRFSTWGTSQYYAPQWYNNKGTHGEGTIVTVAPCLTTENINAQMESGGKIAGKVTDPSGNGLANISVNVNTLNNVRVNSNSTNAQGEYNIPVPAGTYKVQFNPVGSYVSQWYNNKPGFSSADPVTATAGQTTNNINAQFAVPKSLTISGEVRTAAGAGIPGVVMNGLINNPVTDANGNYSGTVSYGFGGGGTGVIPVKSGYSFVPPARYYDNISTNQTNQNYTGTLGSTPPTYYDQFPGPGIDSAKWDSWEFVREIREVNGQRKLVSKTAAYGSSVTTNRLEVKTPSGQDASGKPVVITQLEADVAVTEFDGNFGPNANNQVTRASAGVVGLFYNDGTGSAGSYVGDVMAKLRIRPEQGQLVSEWMVQKFTNSEGSSWNILGSGIISNSLTLGQTYRLALNWDPTTKTFTFYDGVSSAQTFQVQDTLQPAKIGWKALRTKVSLSDSTHHVSAPDLWGRISATFDNVTVSGQDASGNAVVVTDDFSSDKLDATKWATYEIVREIKDGKLLSKVRNVNSNTRITNRLSFKNPQQVNEIKAKVALQENLKPNGSSPSARIGGFFYNDTGDVNSRTQGDVWAQVALSGQPAVASWAVVRFNDPPATQWNWTVLASGNFPLPINLGQEYNLSVAWDGAQFTFNCEDFAAYYTPRTPIYPPNSKSKGVETMIHPPNPFNYYDALVSATFDDIQVGPGGQSSLAADLAVTKTASPDPVTVGENLTYTITITNNGPGTASGITLVDAFPAGVTLVSIPEDCTKAGNIVTCGGPGAVLTSGSTVTLTAVVAPGSSGQITNSVTVSGTQTDPNQANNTASVTTTVSSANDPTPPSLTITSHTNGQQVTTANITVSGTASDSGKGDNGIQQVTVNGNRATNDTAAGSGTANWSRQVSLTCGDNAVNVVATDNSTNHNTAAQSITIQYNCGPAAPNVPLQVQINNAPYSDLAWGMVQGATDDYDQGIDQVASPASPDGDDTYFVSKTGQGSPYDRLWKDYRAVSEDLTVWKLILKAAPGKTLKVTWNLQDLLADWTYTWQKADSSWAGVEGVHNLRDNPREIVLDNIQGENIVTQQILLKASQGFPLFLKAGGWNLISLPVDTTDTNPATLFGANLIAIYEWNAVGKLYAVPTAVKSKTGYWVAVSQDTDLVISGNTPSDIHVPVVIGWNLVGPVGNQSVPSGASILAVYGWGWPPDYRYVVPTTAEEGKGYWIASSTETDIW